jgi:hypothetical protein
MKPDNYRPRTAGHHHVFAALLVIAAMTTAAQAQLTISVGDWEFLAGTPSAAIDIQVSNSGEPVELLGINLNVQIADGGVEAGGSITGPRILDVDMFHGDMLFAQNNNGPGGSGSIIPQLFEIGTLTRPGTTLSFGRGDQVLATVILDISNFAAGQSWDVSLHTLNGPTVFLDNLGRAIHPTLVDGQLSVTAIPEPQGMLVLLSLSLMAMAIWRRRGPEVRNK